MPTNTNANASDKPNVWDAKELGCMWRREKKGSQEKYLTGILNFKNVPGFPDIDVPIVVFTNKRKSKDTHPDLRIYLSEKKGASSNAAPAKPARTAAPVAAQTAPNDLI
jgi:hypothetical protein